MKKEKGQIFSLDFLIAMVLAVLAIGMLLNAYEMSVYEIKEVKARNELTAIAMNAGNIFISENQCGLDNSGNPKFSKQGYEINGCFNLGKFNSTGGTISKSGLMIPNEVNCYITLDGVPMTECETEPPATHDTVAVERIFLTKDTTSARNEIEKADYENCIENSGCSIYNQASTLRIVVWK